jgi:hypothetical protein
MGDRRRGRGSPGRLPGASLPRRSRPERQAHAPQSREHRPPGGRAVGHYVIDAKRYKGKIEVRKPFFGEEQLVIGGRDKTKLIAGLSKQAEVVRAGLALIERQVPVTACLCFIYPEGQSSGGGMPLLRSLTIGGYPLLSPRRLAKRLNKPGALGAEEALVVAEALAALFPVA